MTLRSEREYLIDVERRLHETADRISHHDHIEPCTRCALERLADETYDRLREMKP